MNAICSHKSFQTYLDSTDRPYPSLRFRPDDDIIKPIREKELGDWKKMTLEEKKLLYRYSFKRTRAELVGWNIYWKITWAYIFTALSIAFLFMALLNHYGKLIFYAILRRNICNSFQFVSLSYCLHCNILR